MKIDILCGTGSTNGFVPSDLYGVNGRIGLGGSEYALLTLCEGWHKEHDLTLYNNPRRKPESFEQLPVSSFDPQAKRDVLIIFREPSQKVVRASGYKVFFSCDQFTVGDFSHFKQFVDRVVTISPYHSKYFSHRYEIRDAIHIDLPVRTWEYGTNAEKVPNRLIFTSVPDRGLEIVAKTLPRIQREIPDVSLVITSDYRLWGAAAPINQQFVQMFLTQKNVEFIGAVPRSRLIEEQLKAQIHYYPFSRAVQEELFCLAVAESQVAGVLPISSADGALETTNMGVVIDGYAKDSNTQAHFIEKVVEYLRKPELPEIQKSLQEKARKRFSLDNILKQWDEKVFK